MQLDEFDSLVKDGTISTDSIIKIRDAIVDYNNTIDSLTQEVTTSKQRISDLQETNGKLYLRVTTGSDTDTVQNETKSVDDILKNWGDL